MTDRVAPTEEGEGPSRAPRRGSRYDRVASAHTVRGIDPQDLEQLRVAARAYRPRPGHWEGVEPWWVFEFLELTGVAPVVLAQAPRFNLRCEADPSDGRLHVRFTRHKKHGIAGEQDLPVVTLDDPGATWIPQLVARFRARPYSPQWVGELLRAIGAEAGVPCSARALRHTCGIRVGSDSRDPAVVQAWLNCSALQAVQYVRVSSSRDPRVLALSRGANGRPLAPGVSPSPGGGAAGRGAGT